MSTVTLDYRIPFDALGLAMAELEASADEAFTRAAVPLGDLEGVSVGMEGSEDMGATGILIASGELLVHLDVDAAEGGSHPELVTKHYVLPVLEGLQSTVGGYPIRLVFGEPGVRRWAGRG